MSKKGKEPPTNEAESLQNALTNNQLPAADTAEVLGEKYKRKQPELPAMTGKGVEKPQHPDLDDATEAYVAAEAALEKPKASFKAAKTNLLDCMKSHGLEYYEAAANGDVRIVSVKHSAEKLEVKTAPKHEAGEFVEVGEE